MCTAEPTPSEAKVNEPGLALGGGDEVLDGLDAALGRNDQHIGHAADDADRFEIVGDIVAQRE